MENTSFLFGVAFFVSDFDLDENEGIVENAETDVGDEDTDEKDDEEEDAEDGPPVLGL